MKCPTCKSVINVAAENKWRPFCSERCKLIDLGAWMDGSHHIAGDELESPVMSEDKNITKH